jgi:hypothetical protein
MLIMSYLRDLSMKLYRIYVCYTNITFYRVIYSVRYYSQFHVTAVRLGTYYPWIRRSAFSRFSQFPNSRNDSKRNELWMCTTMKCWWQHLGNIASSLRWPKVKRASCGRLPAGESWREIHSDRVSAFSHSPEVRLRYFYCWNAYHFDITKTKPLLQTLTPTSAGIKFVVFTTIAFLELKILRQRLRLAF